jgi:hypothetical protein
MLRRTGIVAALFLAAGCVGADAQFTWKNVPIGGRSDFSIDMPAKVDPETKLGDALFVFFAATDDDDILCMLSLNPYTADVTEALAIAGVGSEKRNVFCSPDDKDAKDFDTLESKAAVNSGYPSGICASIFTNASGKKPAEISTAMVVAAPAGLYDLQCHINAEDQDDLEVDWATDFEDFAHHIQDSLKLPVGKY